MMESQRFTRIKVRIMTIACGSKHSYTILSADYVQLHAIAQFLCKTQNSVSKILPTQCGRLGFVSLRTNRQIWSKSPSLVPGVDRRIEKGTWGPDDGPRLSAAPPAASDRFRVSIWSVSLPYAATATQLQRKLQTYYHWRSIQHHAFPVHKHDSWIILSNVQVEYVEFMTSTSHPRLHGKC